MEWEDQENNQQKHQFKSYYCASCNQVKPCGELGMSDKCCPCYFQREKKQAQKYLDYQVVYQRKVKEQQGKFWQLRLLKSYLGCLECGSKEVDAVFLYDKNKLVCQPCLVRKKGGSSGPISFWEKVKFYKKWWKIDLREWLENFSQLPVNEKCAKEWAKDKGHLENCWCLEKEVRELVEFWTNSLKEYGEKLKGCKCEKSEKFRVGSDDYAWCEKCDKAVRAASKKRVIKNRNDPRFWGASSRWKILCLGCIGKKYYEKMVGWQRKKFREYIRRGYI